MGKCDLYTRLDLRLQIDVAGRPVLIERAVLDPLERPRTFAGQGEAFRCSGTLILVGYPLPQVEIGSFDDVWLSADEGPDFAIVRGVSRSVESLRDALLAFLPRSSPELMTPDLGVGDGADDRKLFPERERSTR